MSKKRKIVPIDYTSRDFNSIREDLMTYVRRYYPDTYKDFSEASFGSLMIDTVSYVGDMLSFYLDYQANECFMDTSIEYGNILKHAKQMGYKFTGRTMTYGMCEFFILIPAAPNAVYPDTKYMPVLKAGSTFSTPAGTLFTLNENVDFAQASNDIVVARADDQGAPTYFAVKSQGQVVSGETQQELINVGDFQRFLRVEMSDENVGEIISVHDDDGNEYFEVDYLSQDVVLREVADPISSGTSVMKPYPVPRRFVVEHENDATFIQFGYGSDEELKSDSVIEPNEIVLKVHGKNYVTNTSFDPKNLTSTDKFGIAPSNTVLLVTYRKVSRKNSNVGSGIVTEVAQPRLFFRNRSELNETVMTFMSRTLEVNNPEPITGNVSLPTTEEIKRRAIDVFATQNRAVTRQDYVSCVYSMPTKFGAVKRCAVLRDKDEMKRNLNIYVISESETGKLVPTTSSIKSNLRTWLNEVRMMSDSIDILDAIIINVGIDFRALVADGFDSHIVLGRAIKELTHKLTRTQRDLGEPFYITDVYKILKDVDGILDVVEVTLKNLTSGNYSLAEYSIEDNMSPDGRVLMIPNYAIMEIRYPYTDITGDVA